MPEQLCRRPGCGRPVPPRKRPGRCPKVYCCHACALIESRRRYYQTAKGKATKKAINARQQARRRAAGETP